MATYAELVDDILRSESVLHDDHFRNKASVLFNVILVSDRLKRERLNKDLDGGQGSRGATDQLTIYQQVDVRYESSLSDRGYFDMPGSVLDIRANNGIGYIVYNRQSGCRDNLYGVHFTVTTPAEADMLWGSAFQKPRPSMPYYFRARYSNGAETISDRVWLLGINPNITSVEVGLYLTVGDITTIDPDSEIDLPADMLLLLKYQVLNLERWCFSVPQESLKNEGRSTPVGAPQGSPPPTVSINSPMLDPNA